MFHAPYEDRKANAMGRTRLSVAGLIGVVLIAALGLAAIRNASELWAAAVVTLAAMLLGVGVLGCIFRRGEKRAFWVGFTLFGVGSLFVAIALEQIEISPVRKAIVKPLNARLNPPIYEFQLGRLGGVASGTRKECESILAILKKRYEVHEDPAMPDPSGLTIQPYTNTSANYEAWWPLTLIVHGYATLISAGLGGIIARLFYSTRGGVGEPASEP